MGVVVVVVVLSLLIGVASAQVVGSCCVTGPAACLENVDSANCTGSFEAGTACETRSSPCIDTIDGGGCCSGTSFGALTCTEHYNATFCSPPGVFSVNGTCRVNGTCIDCGGPLPTLSRGACCLTVTGPSLALLCAENYYQDSCTQLGISPGVTTDYVADDTCANLFITGNAVNCTSATLNNAVTVNCSHNVFVDRAPYYQID